MGAMGTLGTLRDMETLGTLRDRGTLGWEHWGTLETVGDMDDVGGHWGIWGH